MQSLPADPRTKLLSAIDLGSSRVEFSDTPIVLLCGGPARIKERPDDPDPPVASLRDAITRANTSYEVFRPEEITSWHADGVYKNLVSFEADLASVCSLVVIVLESVGALAELGAFSQHDELRRKLIVVLPREFRDDSSFVNLGLLRHIAEVNDKSIKTYPWDISAPESISQQIVDDVIEDIQQELGKLKKTEVLEPVPENRTAG
ncbi:MAG: retron St85 family effector protein [Rhodocyclales bacterium]|nr:retron St85 family effector protein [Rhodocyclales bacterium]